MPDDFRKKKFCPCRYLGLDLRRYGVLAYNFYTRSGKRQIGEGFPQAQKEPDWATDGRTGTGWEPLTRPDAVPSKESYLSGLWPVGLQ